MSDLQNPIFESEKEFLERQEQEYRNALLNNVEDLKEQTTQLGKGALLLAAAVSGAWAISKLISGSRKKRKKKKAAKSRGRHPRSGFFVQETAPQAFQQTGVEPIPGTPLDFSRPFTNEGDTAHYNAQAPVSGQNQQLMPARYAMHNHFHASSGIGPSVMAFMQSDLMKSLAKQVMPLLLAYLGKKAKELLLKNTDIATEKGIKTHDVDFTDLNADAGKYL